MVEELGRLEKVDDLRSVWHNEASDFTPWLQANIDLLAEKLGLDIQLVDREVAVGQFSADLVGEETSSGRPVVIENQLAQTDHDHLGKLITYSAGKGGGVIIWVAREIRAEHRTALDWLNGATRGAIDFYGVEVELLRIGVSPLAPHFNVVVAPKPVETGASGSEAPSERRQRYHDFFADLLKRIKERPPRVTNASKVGYQSFIGTPSGRSGFVYGLAFTSGGRFRLELYIDTGNRQANKAAFDQFVQDREAIDVITDLLRDGPANQKDIVIYTKEFGLTRRPVIKVLDRYCGGGQSRWTRVKGPKNARVYTLDARSP